MVIESLKLENFRNYQELRLRFDPGTNIFLEIMPRAKPIFWNPFTSVGPPSPTKEAKTKR